MTDGKNDTKSNWTDSDFPSAHLLEVGGDGRREADKEREMIPSWTYWALELVICNTDNDQRYALYYEVLSEADSRECGAYSWQWYQPKI